MKTSIHTAAGRALPSFAAALLALPPVGLALAQTTAAPPAACQSAEYRQFDFWLGEWEVFLRNGKKAGDSRIACVCVAPACVQSFRHCWRSFALAGRSSLQIVRVGKGVPICNTPAISV